MKDGIVQIEDDHGLIITKQTFNKHLLMLLQDASSD